MKQDKLNARFRFLYGSGEAMVFFAPGRVNLIGEHTDYNGGFVLPCALSFGTTLVVRKNSKGLFRFASENFPFSTELNAGELHVKQGKEWVNYPLGVIEQFRNRGIEIPALDLLYSGDIPNGAGLSSSASIEMVTAVALNELTGANIDRLQLVKMCQAAENQFVGMNCGIMDQFVVGMGQKDSAVFLNCRTLEYEIIPLHLDGHSIVVSNTNKRRELAESKYNERVSECAEALKELREVKNMTDLSDIRLDEFLSVQNMIRNEVIRRRARHVITENERVLVAISALKSGDLVQLGQLMNLSHDSLKSDYEVTGKELDSIVSAARSVPGVLGSRMTGAGFGGCSVSIVRNDAVENFTREVGRRYKTDTGLTPDFYVASTGDGACRLE